MNSIHVNSCILFVLLIGGLHLDRGYAGFVANKVKMRQEERRAQRLAELSAQVEKIEQQVSDIEKDITSKVESAVWFPSSAIQLRNNLRRIFREYHSRAHSRSNQASSCSPQEVNVQIVHGWIRLINSYGVGEEPLINRFIMSPNIFEKALKFEAMIDFGLDVNGTDNIGEPRSIDYHVDSHFPLKMIIEMEDEAIEDNSLTNSAGRPGEGRTRIAMFRALFAQPEFREIGGISEIERPQGIERTLSVRGNQHKVLKSLVDEDRFEMYNILVHELSTKRTDIEILERIHDPLNNISDAFHSPLLDYISEQMKYRWDHYPIEGEKHVFIYFVEHAILKNPKIVAQGVLSKIKHFKTGGNYSKDPFSREVVEEIFKEEKLSKFGRFFSENVRLVSPDFKAYSYSILEDLQEFIRLGRYRNRLLEYLNSVALRLTDNGPANPTKMLRFFDANNGFSQMNQVFWGKEIVFNKQNTQWHSPTMFSGFYRNHETVRLLLSNVNVDPSHTDSVDMNIFHLVFPLSELLHQKITQKQDFGYEAGDLSQVVAVLGDQSEEMEQAALETIQAILNRQAIFQSEDLKHQQNIQALKQLSHYNKTPVALAAQFGFVKCFDAMKRYLMVQGEWNDSDHRFESRSLAEVMADGIRMRLLNHQISATDQYNLELRMREFHKEAEYTRKHQLPLADWRNDRHESYKYTAKLVEIMMQALDHKHGIRATYPLRFTSAWSRVIDFVQNARRYCWGGTDMVKGNSSLEGLSVVDRTLHKHYFANYRNSVHEVQWSYVKAAYITAVQIYLSERSDQDSKFEPKFIANLFTHPGGMPGEPSYPVLKNSMMWKEMCKQAHKILLEEGRLQSTEDTVDENPFKLEELNVTQDVYWDEDEFG